MGFLLYSSLWGADTTTLCGLVWETREVTPITTGFVAIAVLLFLMGIGLPIGFAMMLVGAAGLTYMLPAVEGALDIVGRAPLFVAFSWDQLRFRSDGEYVVRCIRLCADETPYVTWAWKWLKYHTIRPVMSAHWIPRVITPIFVQTVIRVIEEVHTVINV